MKHSNIEDRLALIGALIVLFGVTMAAEDALARDAKAAAMEATEHAAEPLAPDNGIELDIRLGDHTSMLIAGRQ